MYRLATWPEGTPAHSQAAVEASKSDEALDGMLVAAKIMIGMAIELLTDEDLRSRATAEFVAARADAGALQPALPEF
jgi:hypothetical protein